MSDLQILTGISILISGFIQLRCGLSAYHWQLLLYLAYFSSLTHLSCLTFLRRYLYEHKVQRTWRLMAMSFNAVMLCVGLMMTSSYDLTQSEGVSNSPTPSDYAICFIRPSKGGITLVMTTITVLLICIGFANRVLRLHKTTSIDILGALRLKTSRVLRRLLWSVYKWSNIHHATNNFRHLFIYRPLLAFFLTLRVSLDVWSSMFLEVSGIPRCHISGRVVHNG